MYWLDSIACYHLLFFFVFFFFVVLDLTCSVAFGFLSPLICCALSLSLGVPNTLIMMHVDQILEWKFNTNVDFYLGKSWEVESDGVVWDSLTI